MVFPDQTPTLKMKLDTKRRKLNTQREMFNFNYIVLLAFNCFGEMKCFLSISFFFCCLLLLLDSSSFPTQSIFSDKDHRLRQPPSRVRCVLFRLKPPTTKALGCLHRGLHCTI